MFISISQIADCWKSPLYGAALEGQTIAGVIQRRLKNLRCDCPDIMGVLILLALWHHIVALTRVL